MTTTRFNLKRLYGAIDAKRQHQRLSWAALGRQVGVSASTIRRFSRAEDAEADGVLALIRWLGAVPEDFIDGASVSGERLACAGDGCVRVDMKLVAVADGDPRGARGRTRTSIQRLVDVAHRSDQSVASLTRLVEA